MNFLSDVRRHRLDYSLLAATAIGFIVYFVLSRHSPIRLMGATACFACVYWLWGVWHHGRAHHLTAGIVLEYLLVAVLGTVLVATLLL